MDKYVINLHALIVVLLHFTGCPDIVFFPAVVWCLSSAWSFYLTEEKIPLEIPAVWNCRPLAGLGLVYLMFHSLG